MRKKRSNQGLLIGLTCFLTAVLLCLVGVAVMMSRQALPRPTEPTDTQPVQTTAPIQTTAPATIPNTEPTAAPTTQPTTAPTTEPQPEVFTLTFAGDCTFGNSLTRTGKDSFNAVVGEDYDYPFAKVVHLFTDDDATFVNLEVPLTNGGTPDADKRFVFRGKPEFTQILTRGSVEFANIANNHMLDYGKKGREDTMTHLDAAGVAYAKTKGTVIFTTESGLTIGVYAENYPGSTGSVVSGIKKLKEQGAELIIACMHWGTEYHYKPSSNQKKIAHAAIDAGADIVYGHHPHVLQPIEEYGDGIIYYSLGNFSFGGNVNPPDKDTAILRQQVIRDPDGTVRLGELTRIPCYVTGVKGYGNDFQPVLMEPDTKAYDRTLRKLDGTYEKDVLEVGYRDDLFGTEATEPQQTQPPEPTEGTESTEPKPTEPAATEPKATEPAPADPPAEDPAPADPPAEDPAPTQ